jgi:hypothetical protein
VLKGQDHTFNYLDVVKLGQTEELHVCHSLTGGGGSISRIRILLTSINKHGVQSSVEDGVKYCSADQRRVGPDPHRPPAAGTGRRPPRAHSGPALAIPCQPAASSLFRPLVCHIRSLILIPAWLVMEWCPSLLPLPVGDDAAIGAPPPSRGLGQGACPVHHRPAVQRVTRSPYFHLPAGRPDGTARIRLRLCHSS